MSGLTLRAQCNSSGAARAFVPFYEPKFLNRTCCAPHPPHLATPLSAVRPPARSRRESGCMPRPPTRACAPRRSRVTNLLRSPNFLPFKSGRAGAKFVRSAVNSVLLLRGPHAAPPAAGPPASRPARDGSRGRIVVLALNFLFSLLSSALAARARAPPIFPAIECYCLARSLPSAAAKFPTSPPPLPTPPSSPTSRPYCATGDHISAAPGRPGRGLSNTQ